MLAAGFLDALALMLIAKTFWAWRDWRSFLWRFGLDFFFLGLRLRLGGSGEFSLAVDSFFFLVCVSFVDLF
jgi:hypothetical protein